MIDTLLYTSRCTVADGPSHAAVDLLLDAARRFNADRGVTGMLLCARGGFMQFLEGPTTALQEVMARIRSDPLHRDIVVLLQAPRQRRLFGEWAMACRGPWDVTVEAGTGTMTTLTSRTADAKDEALQNLRAFWAGRVAARRQDASPP